MMLLDHQVQPVLLPDLEPPRFDSHPRVAGAACPLSLPEATLRQVFHAAAVGVVLALHTTWVTRRADRQARELGGRPAPSEVAYRLPPPLPDGLATPVSSPISAGACNPALLTLRFSASWWLVMLYSGLFGRLRPVDGTPRPVHTIPGRVGKPNSPCPPGGCGSLRRIAAPPPERRRTNCRRCRSSSPASPHATAMARQPSRRTTHFSRRN